MKSVMSGKTLLISVLFVGLVSQSSCRSLGELSEQKTYSSTPQYGSSPTYGSGGGYHPTPTPTPSYGTTPTPYTPSTPTTPPVIPEIPKHDFSGTCDYWKNHPDAIIAAIGSLGNVGQYFGTACGAVFSKKLATLHDALSNTKTDGMSCLLREGAASYLNSIVNKKFPLSTQQVKDCIAAAMTSEGTASTQAGIFKKANDCHYKF